MEVIFMRKYTAKDLTLAAMVAALYTVMSCFADIFGLAFGAVQFRFSEALCVLPFLFPVTAPGLFIGCLITNLLSPYGPMDVVIGSLATLIAAVWTSRMPTRWLACLPPVVCNAAMVGFTVSWAEAGGFTSALPAAWAYNAAALALTEAAVCFVLGGLLLSALPRIGFLRAMIPKKRLSAT